MSKSNATENDIVKFIFNNVAMPSYGSNLQVNLHTADPGEAGTAATSAPTYTGYAAVAVARDGTGWTVASNQASNTAEVTFPECTGGSDTLTHASVSVVGSGQILYSGALTASLAISNLITPRFPAGTLVMQED